MATRGLFAVAVLASVGLLSGCGGGGSSKNTSSPTTTAATTQAQTTPAAANTNTAAAPTSGTTQSAASGWTLSNGDQAGTRDVGSQIKSQNVSQLALAWTVPISAKAGPFGNYAATPVVVDGVVYTQDLGSNVYAVNLKTGKLLWRKAFNSANEGPDGVNVANGKVYGTTATNAFALSAKTGEQLWSKKLTRNPNEGIDMAPAVHDGTVYVSTVPGNAKAFYAGNGQAILWAMNASTGATKWKWAEVPASLWGNKKVNSGGGQWQPPTFDAQGHLYLEVANPAPWVGDKAYPGKKVYPNGSSRPGKNLYTDSVVELNPANGKLMWYYQLTPHDLHDWDLNNQALITQINGKEAIISAGKGGIAIANDAQTGKLLWKTPVGRHNGHDDDGLITEHSVTGHGKMKKLPYTLLPNTIGGVETPYASDGSTVYFADVDMPARMKSQTASAPSNFLKGPGKMIAIDQATGKIKWQHNFFPAPYGASTVTNDLVFTTTLDGIIWALNKSTGAVVWHKKLPAGSNAPVAIDGDIVVTGVGYPQGKGQKPQLVAYRIGAHGSTSTQRASAGGGKSKGASTKVSLSAGKQQFQKTCSSCHTLAEAGTHGTVGPNLDQLKPSDKLVTHQVINGGGGMPAFGSQLSKSQIASVAAYVSKVAGTGNKSLGGKGGGGGGGAP